MAERKPKVGETWTAGRGDTYVSVLDEPDARGAYLWANARGNYVVLSAHVLNAPLPQPPEWLADRWVNVWPDVVTNTVHQTGQLADLYASPGRIGRVSLTGQWVPCDGKRVLA